MPKLKLNKRQIIFIHKHRLTMSGSDMAKKFRVNKCVVNRYMRKNNLQVPATLKNKFRGDGNRKPFTKKEDKYIINNIQGKSIKQMAADLKRTSAYIGKRCRELNLGEILNKKAENSRFKKGNISANKGKKQTEYMSREAIERTVVTRFKKGHIPHNTKVKNGVVSIRHETSGRPYKYIRLSIGKWYPLHHYKWEKKHGKISKGMCLWFKDNNPLNCTLKNLELITKAENIKRNCGHRNLPDKYIAHLIAGKRDKHLKEEIFKNSELLEMKRFVLKLNRTLKQLTIKNYKNEQSNQ